MAADRNQLAIVVDIAPYFGCDLCGCASWKKHLDERKSNVTSPPSDLSCKGCSHSLPAHGRLGSLSMEDLNKIKQTCTRIGYLNNQIQQASADAAKKSLLIEENRLRDSLKVIHKTLQKAAENPKRPKAIPPVPPFESPSFITIMRNFIIYKYDNRFADGKKRAIDKLHSTLINAANRLSLPSPKIRNSGIVDEVAYEIYYPLWERFCKPNISRSDDTKNKISKNIDKSRESKPLVCSVFGQYFFRSFLPLLKEKLSTYQLTREMNLFTDTFFNDLTEELYHKNSVVCMEEFDEIMSYVHRIDTQLQIECREKDEAQSEGKTYAPLFLPLKRKRDFLRELPPLVESHYATYGASGGSNKKVKQTTIPVIVQEDQESTDPLDEMQIEARDQLARNEEKQGVLTSRIIKNDNSPESLVLLVTVRNIFCRQLPKMPKEYISRLVLDDHHQSLLLIKHDTVVGGICFHPFYERGFVEIAFLAITADEQVRGYGTHLMNHFKSKMQIEKLYYFVTYADNFAVGYFKKQGFTAHVSMEREIWAGYIKDYDGGTLMECHMHPTFDYLHQREIIKKQRACIHQKVKENSLSHIKRKGMKAFGLGTDVRLDVTEIPGINTCRDPATVASLFPVQEKIEEDHILFQKIIDGLLKLPDIWPFTHPVTIDMAPDYIEVIKSPIDLETIQKRLDTKQFYITQHIFFADLRRMLENCKFYNPEQSEYYHCATNIEKALTEKGWEKYFPKSSN